MEKKVLILTIENNQVKIDVDGKVNIEEGITALLTSILSMAEQVVAEAGKESEEVKEHVKGELYDMINVGAANILDMFAPEYELNPDLTAQAMLAAENQFLDAIPVEEAE